MLLILDTETTGVTPESATIEVAGILFNEITCTRIASISTLLACDTNPAQAINRISPKDAQIAPAAGPVLDILRDWAEEADYALAYNLDFDRPRIEALGIRANGWICAQHDIAWPEVSRQGGSLIHTAVELGVPIVSAHRALSDCGLLADMLCKVDNLAYVLNDAATRNEEPTITIVAKVSYDGRECAKGMGFRWNPTAKQWERQIKKCDLTAYQSLDFEVAVA